MQFNSYFKRYCSKCNRVIEVGGLIFWAFNVPYCSQDCRGDYDYDDD